VGKDQEGERGWLNGTHTGREAPNQLQEDMWAKARGRGAAATILNTGREATNRRAKKQVGKAQAARRAWRCTSPHVCPAALGSCGVLGAATRLAAARRTAAGSSASVHIGSRPSSARPRENVGGIFADGSGVSRTG